MKVEFHPAKGRDTKVLAFAEVTVADGIVVRGFRVTDGANGLFVGLPSKAILVNGEQRYWNQVAFTSPEIRERFLADLLESYHRWRKEQVERISPREGGTSVAEDGSGDPPF